MQTIEVEFSDTSGEYRARNRAASQIGARWRGRVERRHQVLLKLSAGAVQRAFRAKVARSMADRARCEALVRTNAAVVKRSSPGAVSRVNDYRMQKHLGSGQFGKVYSARQSGGELVAIKVLSRSILRRKRVGQFGNAFDCVMGEIAVMQKLRHPHVVALLEVIDDPDEDYMFLVMEHVRGGDLSVPIQQKRHVSEAELRTWMRGMLLGLEHVHLSGVTHRDIKPENVLWEPREGA